MRPRFETVFAVALVLAPGPAVWGQGESTPVNFKVAFIGDQGIRSGSRAVLQLIADEGAHAVVHSGDFDYKDDPAAWEAQINAILGPEFPYFASIGNHDVPEFFWPGGYQDLLEARMKRLGIDWEGELGVLSSLRYKGVFILLTAPGIFVLGDPLDVYRDYIAEQLADDGSIWRISSWHKNMKAMQVGGKKDETGWGVYEASRRGGAIVATGHEHSYSRTHLLASCERQAVAATGDTLRLARDDPDTPQDEGRTFVFVSGIAGYSVRDQDRCFPRKPPHGCNGEWASIYTSDQDANHGALFGTFSFEGNPTRAYFYFKDIDGKVPDEFFVEVAGR